MGNVIPWSEIHPSIRSEEPFVAVVIVDPQRQICISELVPFEEQSLRSPEVAAQEMIGAVQAAAARVASGYRARRKDEPTLLVLPGGRLRAASAHGSVRKSRSQNPSIMSLFPEA